MKAKTPVVTVGFMAFALVMLMFASETPPQLVLTVPGSDYKQAKAEKSEHHQQGKGEISVHHQQAKGEISVHHQNHEKTKQEKTSPSRVCKGQNIYTYPLPPMFNKDILEKCDGKFVPWLNFCHPAENAGLGPAVPTNGVSSSWYETDSYMLEQIIHEHMRTYPCQVTNPEEANAFFIPYYSGLDALRYLYGSDSKNASQHGVELVSWLSRHGGKWWARNEGKDHFMVMSRTTWDVGRMLTVNEGWGTSLLELPELKNIMTLVIERRTWAPREYAVPYPTSFHPESQTELALWLDSVRTAKRTKLFAFVGGKRDGRSIRNMAYEQCDASPSCRLLDCGKMKCGHNPLPIVREMMKAEFCLQPAGDTPTRRSTFDGMIAGCIPVFFHNDAAYEQYIWHLPSEREAYSVFIDKEKVLNGKVRIEDVLRRYSTERIAVMRRNVLRSVPRLVYTKRPWDTNGPEDALAVSVRNVLATAKRLTSGASNATQHF